MLKNHRQLDMIDKDEVEDHGVAVEAGAESTTHHRLGSARKPMSNIHGINGFLVPLPLSGELLWVLLTSTGRNTQRIQLYALHGHHYTNAFFAIARQQQQQQQSNSSDGIGKEPFILKRISNEFLFRALLKLCQLERRTHQTTEILLNLRQVSMSMYMAVLTFHYFSCLQRYDLFGLLYLYALIAANIW